MKTELQKELVKNFAWEIAREYQLESEYNTDFLAEMIRRKYWHPEEGTLAIADRTGKKMKKINKKGNRIIDSTPIKNLEKLEEELEDSPKVDLEQGRGYLVSNIVKEEANEIKLKLMSLSVDA